MDTEPEFSLIELILHGGPVVILAYLTAAATGFLIFILILKSMLYGDRSHPRYFLLWIPFPCIVSLFGVSFWLVQLKDILAQCLWEPIGLLTGISELMYLALFGTSVSVILYIVSLIPRGLLRK